MNAPDSNIKSDFNHSPLPWDVFVEDYRKGNGIKSLTMSVNAHVHWLGQLKHHFLEIEMKWIKSPLHTVSRVHQLSTCTLEERWCLRDLAGDLAVKPYQLPNMVTGSRTRWPHEKEKNNTLQQYTSSGYEYSETNTLHMWERQMCRRHTTYCKTMLPH